MRIRDYLALRFAYHRTMIPADMSFRARGLKEMVEQDPDIRLRRTSFVLKGTLYACRCPGMEVLEDLAESRAHNSKRWEANRLATALWQSVLDEPDRIDVRRRLKDRRDPLTIRDLISMAPALLGAIGERLNAESPDERENG